MSYISFRNNNVINENNDIIKDVYFIYDNDGIENAVMDYNGKQYRVRSEVLILNDNNDVYIVESKKPNQYGRKYKIPGGSLSSNKGIIATAISESQEECRFNIKDVRYSKIRIITDYKFVPEWHKRILWPIGLKYSGMMTFVCVARFKSQYKGYIKDKDSEEEMLYGRFVSIKKLIPIHRKAVEDYISTENNSY